VQDTLNLLRSLRTNPEISAYEVLNDPYDWNRYPLAPPGCKAIIYEAPAVHGSWASRGTDAWYLGPSKDHYQCNLFYVPETRAYRISGSAQLFLQHCQVPNLGQDEHLKAFTEELTTETTNAAGTTKGKTLLKLLRTHLDALILPTTPMGEQRVTDSQPPNPQHDIMEFQRVTNSPAIMQARDATAKRNLVHMAHAHQRNARNNTPGDVPTIQRSPDPIPADNVIPPQPRSRLHIPVGILQIPVLCFPFLWHFFHRNHDSCSAVTFFLPPRKSGLYGAYVVSYVGNEFVRKKH